MADTSVWRTDPICTFIAPRAHIADKVSDPKMTRTPGAEFAQIVNVEKLAWVYSSTSYTRLNKSRCSRVSKRASAFVPGDTTAEHQIRSNLGGAYVSVPEINAVLAQIGCS